ncbi:dUTP diphosphatase [Mesorhizobium sp. M8A.F.Ca.ET.021.01.1.1]|uniref:dUTP diphosphatase n=1 Tax=Mesorhizobium sp. M8A.F.Ca.ET.021.01.1.1 TaxID=2496757 RepID=UPI000FCA1C98|nr:dUTP diphosphatase [Mesorhizobium sp. M8A.F.Ca.ET.021.01.1.1]RUW57121.1 dUTP diphosphatase [Mesorhizobium sp. M8A.F.Ca.ET.021.01.1.1]
MINVLVRRNTPTASLPVKGDPQAAGYDVCADLGLGEVLALWPGNRKLISTGLSAAFEADHYMRVAPRSGMANKHGIDVLAGVIDASYRGDIGVILVNHGSTPINIKHGDRIAQIIFEKKSDANLIEVDNLPTSDRGAGGFGSTGV